MTSAGFPHLDISGSTPACDSPELFAANHVLHRLLTPRHSPCALSSLTTKVFVAPGQAQVPPRSAPRIHWMDKATKISRLAVYRSRDRSSINDPRLVSILRSFLKTRFSRRRRLFDFQ